MEEFVKNVIATDKQKLVRTELENAIAQPKESLATNAINVIEQTNIMEIQSKTHVFIAYPLTISSPLTLAKWMTNI
jgi:hypothetical protein